MTSVKQRFGVEPVCRVLTERGVKIAPSGYYAHLHRQVCDRAICDERVLAEITRVHIDPQLGRGVYGVGKVWHQLKREGGVDGRSVPRCQVERLMRTAGLRGVVRDPAVHHYLTVSVDGQACGPGEAAFTADRPNR
ncbi:MAG: IS3 family transposase [Mycobacteriales bacterium]